MAYMNSPVMIFLVIVYHSATEIQFRTAPDMSVSQIPGVLKKRNDECVLSKW